MPAMQHGEDLRRAGRGWRELLIVAMGLAGSGCGTKNAQPMSPAPPVNGPVTLLATGNLAGQDDDPTVALDAAGNIYVVWFSDRDGTKDLYAVHSLGVDLVSGIITWSAPIQITHNSPVDFPPPTQGDNFPSLFIDHAGIQHVAWHRWDLSNQSHILYMKSDGTAPGWTAAIERNVTTGPHFDRFPNIVSVADNDLRIYFGSHTRGTFGKNDMFVSASADSGRTWQAPTAVPSLDTGTSSRACRGSSNWRMDRSAGCSSAGSSNPPTMCWICRPISSTANRMTPRRERDARDHRPRR